MSCHRSCCLFVIFIIGFCIHPSRSLGVVPPDKLWHIRMMSPPLSSDDSLRCGDYSLCQSDDNGSVKHVLRFLEDQSYVGGSFWRYIDQYKEKNCNSKSPILSVSLLYHIQSVQTDRYSVALANGTFSFAESNPSYCSNMKALENYTLEEYHCEGFPGIKSFNLSSIIHSVNHSVNLFYQDTQLVIVDDDEQFYYSRESTALCSSRNRSIITTYVVVSVLSILLICALCSVFISSVYKERKMTRKAKNDIFISHPISLDQHPYSRKNSKSKTETPVSCVF